MDNNYITNFVTNNKYTVSLPDGTSKKYYLPITFLTQEAMFIPIDEWIPNYAGRLEIEYITHVKNGIVAPVSRYYTNNTGIINNQYNEILDVFVLTKKCYKALEMRDHICKYINYFENFYDKDLEYLSYLCQIKMEMELYQPGVYTFNAFLSDLDRYIINCKSIRDKIDKLITDNYSLTLYYKSSINNSSLEYTDEHAKMLLTISFLDILVIPLTCHFTEKNKILDVNGIFMQIYDKIFSIFDVDLYSKLYETAYTTTMNTYKPNKDLWDKQDIRGKNVITHTELSVANIILNIIPRYTFKKNIIMFNLISIRNNVGFNIIDIQYEYNYVPLSSSSRDEDNNSEFDKYEAYQIKQNEALYLQNKINCEYTMKTIEDLYGPFSEEEINFYKNRLQKDGKIYINKFQKELIFKLFFKYFGDTISIRSINYIDYIKLIIVAKKILINNNMIILPHVISGYPEKIIYRTNINKEDRVRMENSPLYELILKRYRNNNIINNIFVDAAIIKVSQFKFIDLYNKDIDNKPVPLLADVVLEEVMLYYLLV